MSIIVDGGTKLAVSGLTGREGSFHGLRNRAYGTDLVAGVTPGKGGQDVEGVPVFDTISEAVEEAGATEVTPGPGPDPLPVGAADEVEVDPADAGDVAVHREPGGPPGVGLVADLEPDDRRPVHIPMPAMSIPAMERLVWHGSFLSWIALPPPMQGIMPAYTSGSNVMSSSTHTCSM